MKIRLEQYRQLHLACDELCVAAAFLEIPCLYGVSDRWVKRGYGSLYSRIMKLTAAMEQNGLLLPEPGGVVRMEPRLYQALRCMGRAERMGRIRYSSREDQGCLYLYQRGDSLIFLEEDGRGGGYLGQLTCAEQLREALTGISGTVTGREKGSAFVPGDWLGALLFERRGCFYETILDLAWSEDGKETNLKTGWERLCRCLDSQENHEEGNKA